VSQRPLHLHLVHEPPAKLNSEELAEDTSPAGVEALRSIRSLTPKSAMDVPGAPHWRTDGSHLWRDDGSQVFRVRDAGRVVWLASLPDSVSKLTESGAKVVGLFAEDETCPAILGMTLAQICALAGRALAQLAAHTPGGTP
jgi:hypothetical protein